MDLARQDRNPWTTEGSLRTLVEGVQEYALLMLDPQGRIIIWNRGAEHLYGYRSEEILGQHVSRFYLEEDIQCGEPERGLREAAERGRSESEGWRVRKDGSRFLAHVATSALFNADGSPRGFSRVTRDVTERRRLNEELERRVIERTAELEAANRELEAFAYSVSHDLRAPLRAMDGFSEILLQEFSAHLPPEGVRRLQVIRENALQMGRLVDSLLAFSRLSRQPLVRQQVEPEKLVREALKDLGAEGGRMEISVGELPACSADPDLLRQVFINLLSNALKFTQKRKEAKLEVGCQRAGEDPGELVYFVRDNGVGFDMQYAHKLFGVFQRLHRMDEYEGTGVGLANVQRIIARHGGRVWAEAGVDRGATFFFTLGGGIKDD